MGSHATVTEPSVSGQGIRAEPPLSVRRPLIRALSARLNALSWVVSDIECWRDGGWVVFCKRGNAEMQIVLTPVREGDWVLQIAPKKSSLFGRTGEPPSASPQEVYQLALDVHDSLGQDPTFDTPRWCWDNYPDGKNSMPRPQMPAA